MLNYKGYVGSVQFSEEDKVLHGKVEFIRSLVNYEASDVVGLEAAFREAVDDYLELCEEEGKKPDEPFKGSFNVRTGTELHRQAVLYAKENNTSLNTVVSEALEQFLHS